MLFDPKSPSTTVDCLLWQTKYPNRTDFGPLEPQREVYRGPGFGMVRMSCCAAMFLACARRILSRALAAHSQLQKCCPSRCDSASASDSEPQEGEGSMSVGRLLVHLEQAPRAPPPVLHTAWGHRGHDDEARPCTALGASSTGLACKGLQRRRFRVHAGRAGRHSDRQTFRNSGSGAFGILQSCFLAGTQSQEPLEIHLV